MSTQTTTLAAADAAAIPRPQTRTESTALRSILLVVLCTILGAAAQILMRWGADFITGQTGVVGILTNWPLMVGYVLLATNMLLLVVALRDGHLSVLYPIIALTYVWVTILSPIFFPDILTPYKLVGVTLIVGGVSLIGLGSRR